MLISLFVSCDDQANTKKEKFKYAAGVLAVIQMFEVLQGLIFEVPQG